MSAEVCEFTGRLIPTWQKWTAESIRQFAYVREDAAQKIADAHNASIDALIGVLRDLRTRVVATDPNCINTTKADEALAAYEEAK